MICTEKGVLPKSEYFFFDPSEDMRTHYYCVLNCGHFYCQHSYSIRRDGNTVPLFLYIIEGEFHLEYERHHYLARKGDIVLIDGQKPHHYYSGNHCEFIYIHFSGFGSYELTNYLISRNHSPLFQVTNHRTIHELMHSPVTKLYYKQPVSDVELSCTIYHCLCSLQDYNDTLSLHDATQSPVIAESISFIRNHLSHDISIGVLAKQASLSTYYYAHLFKKETGMSPMEYVAKCKINIAKTILKTTQQTIGEIAESLGYSSSSSFINAFTARVGVSPLKFRNSNIC